MKTKLFAAGFAVVLGVPAMAQQMTVTANRTTFGVRAGVNFQTINGKTATGNNLKNDLNTGFHAGVNAEIPVGTGSYIQPGILYSMKGAKLEGSETKVNLAYVEVPVNFVYKPVLGTGNMLLGVGPYVGIGVGSNVKAKNGTKTDVEFVDSYDGRSNEFRRFDAGGNLLAGYEFANKLSFQLNAQLGLTDINPKVSGNENETRWRNTGWGLSLGYRF